MFVVETRGEPAQQYSWRGYGISARPRPLTGTNYGAHVQSRSEPLTSADGGFIRWLAHESCNPIKVPNITALIISLSLSAILNNKLALESNFHRIIIEF